MQIRRHITLLATILALVASMASGGGVSRFVHVMVAHGGGHPAGACADMTSNCHGWHAHGHEVRTTHAETDGAQHRDPNSPSDDCPVCAELAANLLAPTLLGFFSTSVEVLAIAHDREAAQLPAPQAPQAVAARPPPFLA